MALHKRIERVSAVQAEPDHLVTSIANRFQSMFSCALRFFENCLVIPAGQLRFEVDAAAIGVPSDRGRIAFATINLCPEFSCSLRKSLVPLDEKVCQFGVLDNARGVFEAVVAVLGVLGQAVQDGDDVFFVGGLGRALAMFCKDGCLGTLYSLPW